MRGNGPSAEDILIRLRDDFAYYAPRILKLRPEAGGQLVPLIFNDSQLLLHNELEEQLATTGMVRRVVPKGRRQGVSTYVGGRFYHRTSMRRLTNTYILAHEQPASDTLFGMVKLYNDENELHPSIGVSNVKQLTFDLLNSSYTVATAGQKAGGRGQGNDLFHGSEVAFWPNAADHFAAAVQTVPNAPGTEIVLESTSDGPSGEWYERCQDAVRQVGLYRMTFLPWFLMLSYRRAPYAGFELDTVAEDGDISERDYMELYGLDIEQMVWRRDKLAELRDPMRFKREYPATLAEGFESSGESRLIKASDVLRARKRQNVDGSLNPEILGVDPAGLGGDNFVIVGRRGPQMTFMEARSKLDALAGAAFVGDIIRRRDPARVNIDVGGLGHAIYTIVRQQLPPALSARVHPVNFGDTSQRRKAVPRAPGAYNRRAEMWTRMRDWLESPEGVSIHDDDTLHADLIAPQIKNRTDGTYLLESKEDMRKRGAHSPDRGDALALTFASLDYIEGTPAKPTVAFGDAPTQAQIAPTFGDFGFGGGAGGWMR